MGPAVFEGTYDDVVGTYLLFDKTSKSDRAESSEEYTEPNISEPSSRKSINSTFVVKTSKRLNCNRVFLKPKQQDKP